MRIVLCSQDICEHKGSSTDRVIVGKTGPVLPEPVLQLQRRDNHMRKNDIASGLVVSTDCVSVKGRKGKRLFHPGASV